MAYIPDEVIERCDDISNKAFKLHCFYCKHGGLKNNRITVKLQTAANELFNGDLSNCARYHRELLASDWITIDPHTSEIILSIGFYDLKKADDPVVNFTTTDEDPSENEEDITKDGQGADQVVNSTTSTQDQSLEVVNFTTKADDPVVKNTGSGGKIYHLHIKDSLTSLLNQKEKKNIIKKKKVSVQSHELPDDFQLTDDLLEWMETEVPELSPVAAFEKFLDYWSNITGKKALKKNWSLTFKTNMRLYASWDGCCRKKQQEDKGDTKTKQTAPRGIRGSGNTITESGSESNGTDDRGDDLQLSGGSSSLSTKYGANPVIRR